MPTLRLPELLLYRKHVGKNLIRQVGEAAEDVDTKTLSDRKICEITNNLGQRILIYPPRISASTPKAAYKLRLKRHAKRTSLVWIKHISEAWPTNPASIVNAWKGIFRFVTEDAPHGKAGLREPQLGALHAVAAHWTVKDVPATVVMPTGTGKTETMLALMVYCQCPRILIVVPSDVLRSQLYTKFCTLGQLREIGTIPVNTPNPRVALMKVGIQQRKEAALLATSANVIIATASILSASSDEAQKELASQCTHLFVDEAHHLAAATWAKVKELFQGKHIVQFTATPFRRDRKRIDGQIVYNYPLGRAQTKGYFRPVTLRPVDELDEEEADRAIAQDAIKCLRADLKKGYDHLILARIAAIREADRIKHIYEGIAPELAPVIVHSGLRARERKKQLELLTTRKSRILICVDMFGEGFDLPQLKIAAMHDIHKSLPITLQFVGRFTRTASGVGNPSVVVNIADPKVDPELQALYAQDADWTVLLQRGSEGRVEQEIALQDLIESFQGNLPHEVPLWNLRPATSALVYRSEKPVWKPETLTDNLPKGEVCWHAVSTGKNMSIAVFAQQRNVSWGKYRDIRDWLWNLTICYWNEKQGLLFIHSSDYEILNTEKVAKGLIGEDALPVNGPGMLRVFQNVERPLVKTLGAAKVGSIRFTMYFGPSVTEGLSQVEKAESTPTNVFGWGYEDGNRITRGCSIRKGKVWSWAGGPISDWQQWCDRIGAKLIDKQIKPEQVVAGFLKPVELQTRPNGIPVAIEWGEGITSEDEDRISIRFDDAEYSLSQTELRIEEHTDSGPIHFTVMTKDKKAEYALEIGTTVRDQPPYRYVQRAGPRVWIKRGSGEYKLLEDRVVRDPLVVSYADGSFSYNQYFVQAPCPGAFDAIHLMPVDWTGTNIRKESRGTANHTDSVQYQVIKSTQDEFDVVFDDDGSGEAADVIALRHEEGDRVLLRLIHCKYSSEDQPGARVKDFYELCGQAQKCIKWKHAGFRALVAHMKHRESLHASEGYTRFIKGAMKDVRKMEQLVRRSPLIFEVMVVQPGLSKRQASEEVLKLLGSTDLYLKRTADARFMVTCNA